MNRRGFLKAALAAVAGLAGLSTTQKKAEAQAAPKPELSGYQAPTGSRGISGHSGKAYLDAGYFYAPYVPLTVCPTIDLKNVPRLPPLKTKTGNYTRGTSWDGTKRTYERSSWTTVSVS